MNNQEKLVEKLNNLLTKNYDAEAGYDQAADKVEDVSLKTYLRERSTTRNEFGHALKEEIKKLGGEPNKGTSILGDAHRLWINLKDTFTSGDKAILEETLRGENSFIEEYNEILEDRATLPPTIVDLLEEQAHKAKVSMTEIKTVEIFSK